MVGQMVDQDHQTVVVALAVQEEEPDEPGLRVKAAAPEAAAAPKVVLVATSVPEHQRPDSGTLKDRPAKREPQGPQRELLGEPTANAEGLEVVLVAVVAPLERRVQPKEEARSTSVSCPRSTKNSKLQSPISKSCGTVPAGTRQTRFSESLFRHITTMPSSDAAYTGLFCPCVPRRTLHLSA